MIDLVLRIQTVGREPPLWLIEAGSVRERIPPLTDDDLRGAAAAATPAGQPSILPAFASTWDGLLDHLGSNKRWQPNARILELVGRLLHEHLIRGKIAAHVAKAEARARERHMPLRYVVHVFEGEEDGLLPRLPFELLHQGSFWFRRTNAVGVRLPPESEACDVRLASGASVLIAAAHTDGREPSAEQLAAHVAAVTALAEGAGFPVRALPACTPAALEAELQQGCEVLYLVCHGEEDLDLHGRLALRGGGVTGRQLGEWLEAAGATGRRTQAAILCACSSAVPGRRPGTTGMAQHLAATDRRAAAALGFRAPVDVAWALSFTTEVFGQLAAGRSLEVAVASARRKQPEDDSQWALPLMFAHERDPFAPVVAVSRGFELELSPAIHAEPLDPVIAVALLAKLARGGEPFPAEEMVAARDLVEALGCLPLAIELASEQLRRGAEPGDVLSELRDGDALRRLVDLALAALPPGDDAAWGLIAALPEPGAMERELAERLNEPEGRTGRRLARLRQAHLVRYQSAAGRYAIDPRLRPMARSLVPTPTAIPRPG